MPSLGKYTLVEKLGVGSMGTVYRATDTILDREVALKTIRTNADADAELRERFYREGQNSAHRLQHHNLDTVFDLGEQEDFAYIAMELLSGSDFRRIIEARVQIPLILKIDAMIQICEALGHAHQQGIIHRDVKPSNLFLSENGRPKVLDFGIARLPSSHLTMVGRVLGTPNYMAPEQSPGKALRWPRGFVLRGYRLFRTPDVSPSVSIAPCAAADRRQRNRIQCSITIRVCRCRLDRVFSRVLSKDPNDRYAMAEELLQAISVGPSPMGCGRMPRLNSRSFPYPHCVRQPGLRQRR